eukprot:g1135.t1
MSFFPRFSKRARLEYFKFAIYVGVPIGVVYFFNDPPMLEWIIQRHRYIMYPGETSLNEKTHIPKKEADLELTDIARMRAAVEAVQKRGPDAVDATMGKIMNLVAKPPPPPPIQELTDNNPTFWTKTLAVGIIGISIGVLSVFSQKNNK